MNLLALLAALLPWATTPVAAFTRVYVACGILSLEAQAITVTGRGSLDSVVPLNVAALLVITVWQLWKRQPAWRWVGTSAAVLPCALLAALALVVGALNLRLPAEAADAYQLDRILQIERSGSLAFSAEIDPKANIVGAFYELVLADLQGVPAVGPWLVRFHGIFGLLIFSLAMASVQTWYPLGTSQWPRALLFVVPVVFNQFVLIKNDLFIAAPALVALAWAAGTTSRPSRQEALWAAWLAGLVVAAKLTNGAVALVVGAGVFLRDRHWRPLLTAALGLAAGIVTGGLLLTMWQNTAWYGDPFARAQVEAIGSLNRSLAAVGTGFIRFLLSWFDLGLFTRSYWPNRGGWGGTYGLPFIWALAALAVSFRALPGTRRAAAAAGLGLLALGVTFPDADLAHRLALGPGLLVVVAGASAAARLNRRWLNHALIVVVLLSALQLGRSAVLYIMRG